MCVGLCRVLVLPSPKFHSQEEAPTDALLKVTDAPCVTGLGGVVVKVTDVGAAIGASMPATMKLLMVIVPAGPEMMTFWRTLPPVTGAEVTPSPSLPTGAAVDFKKVVALAPAPIAAEKLVSAASLGMPAPTSSEKRTCLLAATSAAVTVIVSWPYGCWNM